MLLKSPLSELECLNFLSPHQAAQLTSQFGSPVYIYDEAILIERGQQALAFPSAFGLTVRYAMKANPLAAILRTFGHLGIHIDASSSYEAHRAIKAGIPADHIMLTSQELPSDLSDLVSQGLLFNATSLHQLETYGQLFPGQALSVRINSGLGSGHTRSVSVAGPTSSFGIWHEDLSAVQTLAASYKLKIETVHSHIGCGADPVIWEKAAKLTLGILEKFPDATTLNLGGGFKVARMAPEHATDLHGMGTSIAEMLKEFADRTGREIHLEIEPGTFLVANAGSLIATVQDITSTGPSGFDFLKLDTGMNDILRPALHGSQHPIVVLGEGISAKKYVVVGHNCESTDLLTPSVADSEIPEPRLLRQASIGDLTIIEDVGAYCSSLRAIGYNSFPSPSEVLLRVDGKFRQISRRQEVVDLTSAEIYD